jgi:hypothetical protein
MKKIIVVVTLLFACLSLEAQKFLRYQMNNNTYNGFYTNEIGSILHDYKNGIAKTYVNVYSKVYEIPINDINCISVEDATIANGDVGQYSIYEFNYEEGEIKKIFVDNRASLFASHNGDFGANDTILFSSAYNDIAYLFYTDDQGRIKKIFDGVKLFYVVYNNDDCTIIDLSDTSYVQINSTNSNSSFQSLKSSKRQAALFNFFFRQLGNFSNAQNYLLGTCQGFLNSSLSNFAQNIHDIGNNPELHHQSLIVDGLSIGGDIVGIVSSLFAEPFTLGWSTASLVTNAGFLLHDLTDLSNHIWPDSEQMQKYRDYYQKRYSIHVAAIAAENVSYTSATLRGEATSSEGLNGSFTFSLHGENYEVLSGINNTSNPCIITANASKLKPGRLYFYSVHYTCVVDGLQLVFHADNIEEFMTLSPTAYTGEVPSKSSDRAEVTCLFYKFPKGAICGVEYSCNDGKAEKRTNATHEGEYYFTLTPLKSNTTYTYQAFVVIDGVYFYADEKKQFTTGKDGLCPDGNHPHFIDIGLQSGIKWACCNVGASKPEQEGGIYAWGETSEKDDYTWATYIHCDGSAKTCHDIGYDIGNTSYDVAVSGGGRMPKFSAFTELKSCQQKTTIINGVSGTLFTGPNGNSIFMPSLDLWASTASTNNYHYAQHYSYSISEVIWGGINGGNRCYGRHVRAIKE